MQETIDPGEELLGTVICVEDDGDAVLFRKSTDMECPRDCTRNCGGVVLIVKALSSIKLLEHKIL
jgi:hypothetical protein